MNINPDEYINTGINVLDRILSGGIIKDDAHRIIGICGPELHGTNYALIAEMHSRKNKEVVYDCERTD